MTTPEKQEAPAIALTGPGLPNRKEVSHMDTQNSTTPAYGGGREARVALLDEYDVATVGFTLDQRRIFDSHLIGALTEAMRDYPGGPETYIRGLAEAGRFAARFAAVTRQVSPLSRAMENARAGRPWNFGADGATS